MEKAIGFVKKNAANGTGIGIDTYNTVPLGRRLEDFEAAITVNDCHLVQHSGDGNGIVREFKYIPKSDRKKKGDGTSTTTKGRSIRRSNKSN